MIEKGVATGVDGIDLNMEILMGGGHVTTDSERLTRINSAYLALYPSQNETGNGCLSKSLWSHIRICSRHDLKSGFYFGTGIGEIVSAVRPENSL